VIPRPDLAITAPENAAFYDLVKELAAYPSAGGFAFDPNALVSCETADPLCPPERAAIENIKYIRDAALTNLGSRVFSGIDFVIRYDYDLGEWGSLNVGAQVTTSSLTKPAPSRTERSMTASRTRTPETGCSASATAWAGLIRRGTSPCSRIIGAMATMATTQATISTAPP